MSRGPRRTHGTGKAPHLRSRGDGRGRTTASASSSSRRTGAKAKRRSGAVNGRAETSRAATSRSATSRAAGRTATSRAAASRSETSKRSAKRANPSQPNRSANGGAKRRAASRPEQRHHQATRRPSPLKQRRVVNRREPSNAQPRFGIGQSRPRLWMLICTFAALLTVILVQVVQLQTSDGERYRVQAASQWSRTSALPADRGSIFDRNGEELAVSVPAVSISINPMLIESPAETSQLLQDVMGISDEQKLELYEEMVAKDRGFVYVARQVDVAVGDELRALGIEGINIDDEDKRVVPGGTTGLSVIGRTDIDGNGISGLEYQFGGGEDALADGYENILTGTPGEAQREVGEEGQSIAGTEQVTLEPTPGNDLVLTLDRSIQFSVEQALVERVTTVEAKLGTAMVMDTDTGDILAMASVTRDTETGEVEVTSGNFAAVNAYEPGSVAKVITVAAGLNEGAVTPDTTFVVPYCREYYDEEICDAGVHPDNAWTVEEILVASSNIGTIDIQQATGPRVHYDYLRKFGLGEVSALDFPGESAGILKPYDDLWGSETVTIAYGQGMASTAIQLAAAVNTIANDGTYVAPRLVDAVVGDGGEITEAPPSATHEVVTPEVAKTVQLMMREVVCRGTGSRAQIGIENFSVAGKTGTGLKPHPNGEYEDELGRRLYFSSFAGFFPAEDPQVTVLVSIDEPNRDLTDTDGTALRYGGTAAAPVFASIAPSIVHELGIEPPAGGGACPET